jgi:hypothetical protein
MGGYTDPEESKPSTPFGPHFQQQPEQPEESEQPDDLLNSASKIRKIYEAFVARGFTEQQALYLCGEILKRPPHE